MLVGFNPYMFEFKIDSYTKNGASYNFKLKAVCNDGCSYMLDVRYDSAGTILYDTDLLKQTVPNDKRSKLIVDMKNFVNAEVMKKG